MPSTLSGTTDSRPTRRKHPRLHDLGSRLDGRCTPDDLDGKKASCTSNPENTISAVKIEIKHFVNEDAIENY